MEKGNKDFSDCLDTIFCIQEEAAENKGEDSYYCGCTKKTAIVSVYDGCGGLGAKEYESFGGRTGAYMASRILSGAVHDWHHHESARIWSKSSELLRSLDGYIKEAYNVCLQYAVDNVFIRGSMVRDFPSTLALAYAQQINEEIVLHVVWVGDSRIYLLDEKGLAQLTVDDTDSADAMENLLRDEVLTNVVSSDGKYRYHYKKLTIDHPMLIFAATDGCFGYISSPMEFEAILLKTLINSDMPETFKNNLKKELSLRAGDDIAFGCMSFLFGNFQNTRKCLAKRWKQLSDFVLPKDKEQDLAKMNEIWRTYKPNYERCL